MVRIQQSANDTSLKVLSSLMHFPVLTAVLLQKDSTLSKTTSSVEETGNPCWSINTEVLHSVPQKKSETNLQSEQNRVKPLGREGVVSLSRRASTGYPQYKTRYSSQEYKNVAEDTQIQRVHTKDLPLCRSSTFRDAPTEHSSILARSNSSGSSSSSWSKMMEELSRSGIALASSLADGPNPNPLTSGSISKVSSRSAEESFSLLEIEVRDLKELLWGNDISPSLSWKQGFCFNDEGSFHFGLTQKQGGPCGVLAAIQGHLIAEIWAQCTMPSFDFQSMMERDEKLMDALTTALLQCTEDSSDVKIVYSTFHDTSDLEYFQLINYCHYRTVQRSRKAIKETLLQVLDQYKQEEGWGIILFLFSLLLSKTVQTVCFLHFHWTVCGYDISYCTQELVNLLLTGQATTNVFDGDKSVGDEGGYLLKGIQKSSRIGFLTLLEWNRYVEVGDFLKCPEFPVWIVCAESHFTVLFSPQTRHPTLQEDFELFHHDSLSLQKDPTRFMISKCQEHATLRKLEDQQIGANSLSILELVIQTKWSNASISTKVNDLIT